METIDIRELFKNGLLAKKREFFPYPERHCPFCERELDLVEAIHLEHEPMHYKALFMCFNEECGAYEEEARQAYSRVYYSSQEAFDYLEGYRINVKNMPRKI